MLDLALYLIPTPLGEHGLPLPSPAPEIIGQLTDFVAESAKNARRFLKLYPLALPLQDIQITELNEHTPADRVRELIAPLQAGRPLGLVSDAGCPGVADPGAPLIRLAHRMQVPVVPLVGPSSILLALMASGLGGQHFRFLGYLPADEKQRIQTIKTLERDSRQTACTQIFIETPYRNSQMLTSLLTTCSPDTWLCTATDLTQPTESVITAPIDVWRKKTRPNLNKRPTVFVLRAAS